VLVDSLKALDLKRPIREADLRLGATGNRRIEVSRADVIQAPKLWELESYTTNLPPYEWAAINESTPYMKLRPLRAVIPCY
jgi:hypothetical protein